MKKRHIIAYHAAYWLNHIVTIWTFVYFIYGESWYRGAYFVLLVLMPFFYINYGWLIPSLIDKKYQKFFWLTFFWLIAFILAYSRWTIYQRNLLYGEPLWQPDYIETLNNVIAIWLISSGSCLFENWIKNRDKNQKLLSDKKRYLLKSEQNSMLSNLLSDYLNSLESMFLEEIPDKILLISDFYKYILYNRNETVPLATEMHYLEIYSELKNTSENCIKIIQGDIEANSMIRSSQIIAIVNRLVLLLYINQVVKITIDSGIGNDILVSTAFPEGTFEKELFVEEFIHSKLAQIAINGSMVLSVDRYFGNIRA